MTTRLAFRILGIASTVFLATCSDDRGPLEPGPPEPTAKVVSPALTGGEVRVARILEPARLGVQNPAGLAYVPAGRSLLAASAPGTSPAAASDIEVVSLFGDGVGSVRIETGVTNPVNVTFDASVGRLLVLESDTDELVEIWTKADGNLDPQTLRRTAASGFGVGDPRGLAVDPTSGHLYILDSATRRIVVVETNIGQDFDSAPLSEVNLAPTGLSNLHGLAVHPVTGNLFTLDASGRRIHELTKAGDFVASRDIPGLEFRNLQGIVFGPSGDMTDSPSEWSLYVADAGSGSGGAVSEGSRLSEVGFVAELSFDRPAGPAAARIAATVTGTLIQTIETWQYSPPSPDPAGITYLHHLDRLLISDSEVNEMQIYDGANQFEISRSGTLLDTHTVVDYSR